MRFLSATCSNCSSPIAWYTPTAIKYQKFVQSPYPFQLVCPNCQARLDVSFSITHIATAVFMSIVLYALSKSTEGVEALKILSIVSSSAFIAAAVFIRMVVRTIPQTGRRPEERG